MCCYVWYIFARCDLGVHQYRVVIDSCDADHDSNVAHLTHDSDTRIQYGGLHQGGREGYVWVQKHSPLRSSIQHIALDFELAPTSKNSGWWSCHNSLAYAMARPRRLKNGSRDERLLSQLSPQSLAAQPPPSLHHQCSNNRTEPQHQLRQHHPASRK